jgi:hypothetical protein
MIAQKDNAFILAIKPKYSGSNSLSWCIQCQDSGYLTTVKFGSTWAEFYVTHYNMCDILENMERCKNTRIGKNLQPFIDATIFVMDTNIELCGDNWGFDIELTTKDFSRLIEFIATILKHGSKTTLEHFRQG